MMFTRPPGLPIMGEGGVALTSTGSWIATWSPKLSRITRSDFVGSFHWTRKATQPPLWTARTVSVFTAGSGWCGSVTACGSMTTVTGRASFQTGAPGSRIGPAPGTRAATSGAWAAAGPPAASRATSAANTRRAVMASVSSLR
jgi:hypothetical protein